MGQYSDFSPHCAPPLPASRATPRRAIALVSLSLPSSCAPANPIASSSFHLLSSSSPRPGSSNLAQPRPAARWRAPVSSFSFLPSFLTGNKKEKGGEKAERLKEELLAAVAPLDRGAEATPEDKERVEQIAQELEEVNPTKEPLKSDLLNGKWELLYATSTSILQPQRPKFLRPYGTIYQAINTDTLRAQNMETWPYFNQCFKRRQGELVRTEDGRPNIEFRRNNC